MLKLGELLLLLEKRNMEREEIAGALQLTNERATMILSFLMKYGFLRQRNGKYDLSPICRLLLRLR